MTQKQSYAELEQMVRDRTSELTKVNDHLKREITKRENLEKRLENKIATLTAPESDLGTVSITDLLNPQDLQQIQDVFTETFDVISVIYDVDGRPLTTPSCFTLFGKILRSTKKGVRKCEAFDEEIISLLKEEQSHPGQSNSLVGRMITRKVPIVIQGQHLASWSIGQLVVDESDYGKIRQLSFELDLDDEMLLKAAQLLKPIDSRKLDSILALLNAIIHQISLLALQNRQQGREIKKRTQAEEALRESEKRFRDLAEMLPEAIFEADPDMNLTFGNKQALSIFGYTKADLQKGLNGFDMLVPEDRQRARENAEKMFRGETQGHNEYVGLKSDGSTLPVLFHTSPVVLEGKIKGFRGIIVDIGERKKVEERLQQAQKMESIGNLAAGIAHDFNNVLFPIVGMSEMLLDDLKQGSLEHENAMEILKAGKRGSDLVKQILAFSRQSEHKLIPVRIQQILREVLQLSRATIPSDIEIKPEIQRNCGLVMAEPTQIHQIAMNLITNAFHAVETTGGKISIELLETELGSMGLPGSPLTAGQYALLSVSDNGHGIAPDKMDKIFEPYYTTKPDGKGTGLGLAVVYGIVREHRGDIQVYSEIGKGSVFQVYLPLMKKSTKPEYEGDVDYVQTGTERVLLVDDEEPIVNLVKQMLERLGYHVTPRTSSVEALNAFKANPDAYDVVITDMTMPNMTGDQLARAIISVKPGIPIIICTGFSERISQDKAKAMGIKGFMMKPIVRSKLADVIRKVLDEDKYRNYKSSSVSS